MIILCSFNYENNTCWAQFTLMLMVEEGEIIHVLSPHLAHKK
jgi:hypothetical protein